MTPQEPTLASRIVEFCRFCRSSGLPVGVQESMDALEAARLVGVSNKQSLKSALRAVLCSGKEEWEEFDELFATFWNSGRLDVPPPRRKPPQEERPPQGAIATLLGRADAGLAAKDDQGKSVMGATVYERLK